MGEGCESAVPRRGVAGLGHTVALAAGKHVAGAVDAGGQNGSHRFVDADERGVQRWGVHASGDKVGAVRMTPQVEQALAAERHIRGDDDVAGPDGAVFGIDDGRGAVVDSLRPGLLEDETAPTTDRAGKTLEVFHGMDLRLPIESDRTLDREGQRHLGGEGGGQAEPGGKVGFDAYEVERVVGFGVGVVGDAAEVTVDGFLGHQLRDVFDCGLVGLPIGAGGLVAVFACKFTVGKAVKGGDLAGGVAGDAGSDAGGVDDRDGLAGAFERQRGGQPGDARPDDRDVDLQIPAQDGIIGGSGGSDPEGDGFTFRRSIVRCGIHCVTSGSPGITRLC